MNHATPSVLDLEEIAFRAWPAAEVEELSGWRLRFADGVTRRANSVWPNSTVGELTLHERFRRVEEWYRARGVPPRYQISPACRPSDLDLMLAERGYRAEAPTSVQTLALERFRLAGQPPQILTAVLPAPDEEWIRLAIDQGPTPANKGAYLGILRRIGSRGGFALARWKGKPIANGIGVVEGQWLGIFGMATLPEARRRRAATAILGALVAWAIARGAKYAFLQVERDNPPALALYAACGFVEAYPYHFRTRQIDAP